MYIEEAYQSSGRVYPPYFQIQFIPVNVSVDDLGIVLSGQVNCFRKMKRQQKTRKRKICIKSKKDNVREIPEL